LINYYMEGIDTYVYIAMIAAATEIESSIKHNLHRKEKYTLSLFAKNNDKLLRHFKKQGLFEHEDFDKMVEIFVDTFCEIRDKVTSDTYEPSLQSP
jgi:hypothetical protein